MVSSSAIRAALDTIGRIRFHTDTAIVGTFIILSIVKAMMGLRSMTKRSKWAWT